MCVMRVWLTSLTWMQVSESSTNFQKTSNLTLWHKTLPKTFLISTCTQTNNYSNFRISVHLKHKLEKLWTTPKLNIGTCTQFIIRTRNGCELRIKPLLLECYIRLIEIMWERKSLFLEYMFCLLICLSAHKKYIGLWWYGSHGR